MVVSDTSPLRYLIAVDQADILGKLFGHLLIPPAVHRELIHPSARWDVRDWTLSPPDWLEIAYLKQSPGSGLLARLDLGEAEAIQMALDCQADFLLMDERLGRKMATSRGCSVIGALGVLLESHRRGFISDPLAVVDQMRSIGFRVSKTLYLQFAVQLNLAISERNKSLPGN
jgi:predicted nucleic acid-binding protein